MSTGCRGEALTAVLQVALQALLVVDDLHGPAAQHVGRAHQDRVADALGHGERLLLVADGAERRGLELELLEHLAEPLPVLGQVDGVLGGAQDGHAGRVEPLGDLERGLAAELHHHALGLLVLDDVEHVLEGERLEVEAVGGVVVGGDRLRVAVDHDGLVAQLAHLLDGVHAAVVELDALADAVGAAAQDDHRFLVGNGQSFVLLLVGGVEVRSVGLELGRAGVHRLVGGDDAVGDAARPHLQSRWRRGSARCTRR